MNAATTMHKIAIWVGERDGPDGTRNAFEEKFVVSGIDADTGVVLGEHIVLVHSGNRERWEFVMALFGCAAC